MRTLNIGGDLHVFTFSNGEGLHVLNIGGDLHVFTFSNGEGLHVLKFFWTSFGLIINVKVFIFCPDFFLVLFTPLGNFLFFFNFSKNSTKTVG